MSIKKSQISVYVSFTKEYPDAENNNGAFKAGKIKIMPPKGGGIFKMEYISLAVLSQLDSCINLVYYFNKDQPITLNPEKERNIRRQITQIARTKNVKLF